MSTFTPNYNLEKPDASDKFEDFRQSYNDNMDKIDNISGGGGSAHTIVDDSGTSLASESKLQFTDGLDAYDSTGKTVAKVNTTFTEAVTRTNIASGDTFATILGKIKKWFSDLASMFVSKSGDTMSGKLTINSTATDIQLTACQSHTDTTQKPSIIALGNNIADGTAGSSFGAIRIYGSYNRYVSLMAQNVSSSNKPIQLPNKAGTLALTSDIPTIESGTKTLSRSTDATILSTGAFGSTNLYKESTARMFVTVKSFSNISVPFFVHAYPSGESGNWYISAKSVSGNFASNASLTVEYLFVPK